MSIEVAPTVLYQLDVTGISSKDVVTLWWVRYMRPADVTVSIIPPSLFGIDRRIAYAYRTIILVGYVLVMLEGLLA